MAKNEVPDPLPARLAALVEQWRKDATVWLHGIGENQNTRLLTECADQLAALLVGVEPPPETKK